ncbi:hypothetical protein [Kitasatospora fiedleri]|uniref:hypothetical protein n=1 Tax=Kitasatospora fiedleri TaxID=2991545 RepID=UPI00249ACE17|nr:hypothetical protein [Kitasatospora fiedleri]
MTDREAAAKVSQQRAWTIAERLARAGGGKARLSTTPGGYRIELHLEGPAPDEYGVLAALALGDRWGHRRSLTSRDGGGGVQESVWSEVHLPPTDGTAPPAGR